MNYPKSLLLMAIAFFVTLPLFGQEDSLKWLVMYSPSYEANDTRLFRYEDLDNLPNEEDEIGVITHSFSISRRLISGKKFEGYVGLGYAKKINRFSRPFDHCFNVPPGEGCSDFFVVLQEYRIHLAQIPLQAKFYVFNGLALNMSVIPEFSFRKNADEIKQTKLDFYTLEINPGISYETNRFTFGLYTRIFQLKRIDRVLFPGDVYGPLMPDPYPESFDRLETYNPFKGLLMVGYKL